MPTHIEDPETKILAAIAEGLRSEYVDHDAFWKNSPFAWILSRPSRQRGAIGERLVAGWCAAHDLNVLRCPDSDADKIIEGKRVEIKFSTLWKNGRYTFQQIRNQRYDYLLCIGVSPFIAHAWIVKKSEIPFSQIPHQHGGIRGKDTWWISVHPGGSHLAFGNQKGNMLDVYRMLAALRKKRT